MKKIISAGGVVIKKQDNMYLVLLCKTKNGYWGFPKGHVADKHFDETKEQAALREVFEETNIKAEIITFIQKIHYFYTFENEKRSKYVYMYLMKYISGTLQKQEEEIEELQFVTILNAKQKLTFNNDKIVLRSAIKILHSVDL